MPPRKLLLVTYHFPPSGAVAALRMLGLARHQPGFGWQVCVVAPPSMPDEPLDPQLARLVPPETSQSPVPFPQGRLAGLLRRFSYHGVWLPRALADCRRVMAR